MNVILIGMPGSGKSTVGVVLAKLLGLHFCDTDLVLQQHCGKKLQEIIRTEGDAAFFRHEEEVLAALDVQNTVIATGGSAVYSDRAMQHLKVIIPRATRPSLVTRGSPNASFLNVHSTYPPSIGVPSSIYSPYLLMKLPVAT